MPDQLRSISSIAPWFAMLLPLLLGLIASGALRRPPRSLRSDLRSAVLGAGILALVAGFAATRLIGAIGGSVGPGYVLVFAGAVGIAILVFLSSLAGYAVLARPAMGSIALFGVLLGPVVLIGGPLGVGSVLGSAASTAEADRMRADLAARSDGLELAASDVVTTLRSDGVVHSVRLVATVTASRQYDVNVSPIDGGPLFYLHPIGEDFSGQGLTVVLPPPGPVSYVPGTPTRYELTLQAGSEVSVRPGSWELELHFTSFSGLDYLVEVPVEVRPG